MKKTYLFFSYLLFLFFVAEKKMQGQEMIITPNSQLSEVNEDNEIVLEYGYKVNQNGKKIAQKNDPVAVHFINRNSGDTCTTFNIKANSPYHFNDLKRVYEEDNSHNGNGMYDLTSLSKEEIIQRYKLQHTPAPIPDDFHFRNVNWWCSVDIKPNHVLIHYVTIFGGGCKDGIYCVGPLFLANKNIFLVLNQKGEITWQWKDDPVGGSADLSSNGRYLGVMHQSMQPNIQGNYMPAHGSYILDIYTNKKILETDLVGGSSFAEKNDIFGMLSNQKCSRGKIILYRIDTNNKIVYSFEFYSNDYTYRNSNGSEYETIERGFIWNGKTYLYDRDFKQTPFSEFK